MEVNGCFIANMAQQNALEIFWRFESLLPLVLSFAQTCLGLASTFVCFKQTYFFSNW